MLGLSLWEGRLPGQKTIENEDKAAMGSYRPESNFGTSDRVPTPWCAHVHKVCIDACARKKQIEIRTPWLTTS